MEKTILASPKPKVLANLEAGDILYLQTSNNRPPILAVTEDGGVAGTVIVGFIAELVACMAEGYSYVAEIISKHGGACEVEIRQEEG
ncbi:MAG: hypothetical protein ACOY5W_10515 [Pseudomonadota bacterium]